VPHPLLVRWRQRAAIWRSGQEIQISFASRQPRGRPFAAAEGAVHSRLTQRRDQLLRMLRTGAGETDRRRSF